MDQALMRATMAVDDHHWWYRGRRRIIRAELDRLPLPRRAQILDAGCGSGRTLEELVDYGTVAGLELDPDAAQMARGRKLGEVIVGRLEELPFRDANFDLITCLDVIEHTQDDAPALSELLRVTRPGGFLLVTVPAYQALWSLHDEANHHFRRYSRRSLRVAVTAAGWNVCRISSFNSLLLAPAAAVRLAQRRRGPNDGYTTDLDVGPQWLNSVLELPLRAEAAWLARGGTLPAGLSLVAVLRRAWTD
ncbi:MAG: class I SAM-dependent methyltransferase [Actinomycetota bacterium]|nr:class I SAM-dependent methyltransferase [Actinomycetota bacterium]